MNETNASRTRLQVEGRVAQLLNARELVINRGADHGVKVGMKFKILADKPLDITDPETGKVVDAIDREKVRVQAAEVKSKISICRTYRVREIQGGPLYYLNESIRFGAHIASEPPKKVTETLEMKDSSLPPPIDPEDSYVKINDRAVLVNED